MPGLDLDLIRNNPKVFLGYSDVTALHIAITQQCGFVTFHGPMVAVDFGRDDFTMYALIKMIFAEEVVDAVVNRLGIGYCGGTQLVNCIPSLGSPITIVPGRAVGPLIGGNLSLLAASLGTPFEINTKSRILFIEEIDEAPYRIDRMILQLKYAGKLADAAGIILGDFSPQTLDTLQTCISELIVPEGKPTLAGLACGHTSPNITLPFGQNIELIVPSTS